MITALVIEILEEMTKTIFDPASVEKGDYYEVDARGLLCPEPVMMLHNQVRVISPGDIIRLLATDSSTQRDVVRFCEFLSHPLLAQTKQHSEFIYWIQKKSSLEED